MSTSHDGGMLLLPDEGATTELLTFTHSFPATNQLYVELDTVPSGVTEIVAIIEVGGRLGAMRPVAATTDPTSVGDLSAVLNMLAPEGIDGETRFGARIALMPVSSGARGYRSAFARLFADAPPPLAITTPAVLSVEPASVGGLVTLTPPVFDAVPASSEPTVYRWSATEETGYATVTLPVDGRAPAEWVGFLKAAGASTGQGGDRVEWETDPVEIVAAEIGAPATITTEDVILESFYRPDNQGVWFTTSVEFVGDDPDEMEWSTDPNFAEDPAPENIEPMVLGHEFAGKWAPFMGTGPEDPLNAPGADPRTDYSVFFNGEFNGRQGNMRFRRKVGGLWSLWSSAAWYITPPTPSLADEDPWRQVFRTPPNIAALGTTFGGEGYQQLQTGAFAADGSRAYVGQDMGKVWCSEEYEGRHVGEVWYAPPNRGMCGLGCLSLAVDPADPLRVFAIVVSAFHGAPWSQSEGVWRSINGGKSWSRVNTFPAKLSTARQGMFNIGLYPVSGGNPATRRILVAQAHTDSGQNGGNGGVYRSINGGDTWARVANLPWSSFSTIYGVIRHPTNQSRAYLLTSSGVHQSNDEGSTWITPRSAGGTIWDSHLFGSGNECRAMWIDPDDTTHMLVLQGGSDAAEYGLWETTNDGVDWTRIYSDHRPLHFAVGAKNGSGQRIIVVVPRGTASGGANPVRVRRVGGAWVTATQYDYDPNVWQYWDFNGAEAQNFVIADPTDPEFFIIHGRHGPYFAATGSDGEHYLPAPGFYGSIWFDIAHNASNPAQISVALQDQIHNQSGNMFGTADYASLTYDQKTYEIQSGSKNGAAVTLLPDPWPAGATPPVDPKAPGRVILAAYASGTDTHVLYRQNKSVRNLGTSSDNTFTSYFGLPTSQGGGKKSRAFVDHDPAEPNFVYAGENRSINGGQTWIATATAGGAAVAIVAMSKVNGATVWGQTLSGQTLYKSTDRGASWGAPVKVWGYGNKDERGQHFVRTFAGTDNVLLVAGGAWKTNAMPGIYKVAENEFFPIDMTGILGGATYRPMSMMVVNRCAPRWAMFLFDNNGGDAHVILVRFAADYESVESMEDVTFNSTRLGGAGKVLCHDGTGDWIHSNGQGTRTLKAPDDWTAIAPALQANHQAFWGAARPSIYNRWNEAL